MVIQALLGCLFTVVVFYVGLQLQKRICSPLFNPTFFAIVVIIFFLQLFHIPYEAYNVGGRWVGFFLGPATVALAVPIYRQREKLKTNLFPILTSILIGSIAGIISGVLMGVLMGGSREIIFSLVPKSVTTPIAMEISRAIGGIPPLTVGIVILSGIFGATLGPEILVRLGVKDPIAQGLGIGTAAHGLGTSRAVQEGEIVGAFSGLAMGVAGIITAFLAPLILLLW
jgi:predicted murein hydrolase (TIGR00659 family)